MTGTLAFIVFLGMAALIFGAAYFHMCRVVRRSEHFILREMTDNDLLRLEIPALKDSLARRTSQAEIFIEANAEAERRNKALQNEIDLLKSKLARPKGKNRA